LFKSVQHWRKDQQLLLGYYCQVVLEKGLLSDIRAKCRHHKIGHFSRTARQHTRPKIQLIIRKKRTSTSSSLTCGPKVQIAPILFQWIVLFGVPFSNESITDENLNTVEELKRAIITVATLHWH